MADATTPGTRIQWTGERWVSFAGQGMWWPEDIQIIDDPAQAAYLLSLEGFRLAPEETPPPPEETPPAQEIPPPQMQEGDEPADAQR